MVARLNEDVKPKVTADSGNRVQVGSVKRDMIPDYTGNILPASYVYSIGEARPVAGDLQVLGHAMESAFGLYRVPAPAHYLL